MFSLDGGQVGQPLDDRLTVTDQATGKELAGVGIFFQQVPLSSLPSLPHFGWLTIVNLTVLVV